MNRDNPNMKLNRIFLVSHVTLDAWTTPEASKYT